MQSESVERPDRYRDSDSAIAPNDVTFARELTTKPYNANIHDFGVHYCWICSLEWQGKGTRRRWRTSQNLWGPVDRSA